MGEVRRILEMIDSGTSLREVERASGHSRCTLRAWRDDPRYRDATFEFNPAFTYDHTDLLDRATVAQHLCSETPLVEERLDLLSAVIGDTYDIEPDIRGYGRAIKEGTS